MEQVLPGDIKKNLNQKTVTATAAKTRTGKEKMGTILSGLNSVWNRLTSDAGTVSQGIKKSSGQVFKGAQSTFLKGGGFIKQKPWVDAIVHLLDATVTWVQGLLYSIMDVLQVADIQNCRLPYITVRDALHCAC